MHAAEMYYKQVCNALLGGYRTPWNRRWKMKVSFFGLKRSLFIAAMAVGLGFFSGVAFADDGGDVDGNAVVSAACISFNQAKDYEKWQADQAKKQVEHADHVKFFEDQAKKHEKRAKDFANHKVPAGATSCTTTGGLPGFLPATAMSSTGAKVYREIRGR